ncbi:glycerol-3-phosphate O-acyltransferase [Histoplasma capsulatum H143]|uniref:Glycerol-3-phosphate O-acyltransferase n=1 Tax=Ajellomyces capsulatus (strain H143) TaxID=544712 RepID=C6HBC5_AJECH|nr:glycerol-3-phosphate O-acyltransferase [Histoplasma capsulatum H143]
MTQSYRVSWVYDLGIWIFALCLDIFLREICSRGAWRIPKSGPVIIVAAPHANQFVDSAVLLRNLRCYAGRRTSLLTANKTMRDPYIGTMTRLMGAVSVVRPTDLVKPAEGTICLPDPENDPTLVRGQGTNFTNTRFMEGGLIVLPRVGRMNVEQQVIAEILGPEELRLRRPFKVFDNDHPLYDGLRNGTPFNVVPFVDQSRMFDFVYRELCDGGCVGIFPEGGSHDRPNLLPLKAGVALIALGTLARQPDCGLSIISCGLNYFYLNKFCSCAVIEFGNLVQVHLDQIEAFKMGGHLKRNAVGSLLETINDSLAAVTQQAPDRETLMVIQATRRLYKLLRMKLPLAVVIELNRNLLKGYTRFRDEPKVVHLKKAVSDCNDRQKALGIRDHQVEWGDVEQRPWWVVFGIFLLRIGEFLALAVGTLPSIALFWPVFVITKIVSVKKQRSALAASVVKLEGRDVVGSWKIIVEMGLAPISLTGLRIGETGVDVLKSLPPLLVALNPRSASSLRAERQALATQVIEVIDTFGPEILSNFESEKLVHENPNDDSYTSRIKSIPPSHSSSRSRSESRGSVKRSNSFGSFLHDTFLKPLSTMTDDNLNEVNRRIRDSGQKKSEPRTRGDGDSDDDIVVVDSLSTIGTGEAEDRKSR